jgi:hypothetical protein
MNFNRLIPVGMTGYESLPYGRKQIAFTKKGIDKMPVRYGWPNRFDGKIADFYAVGWKYGWK